MKGSNEQQPIPLLEQESGSLSGSLSDDLDAAQEQQQIDKVSSAQDEMLNTSEMCMTRCKHHHCPRSIACLHTVQPVRLCGSPAAQLPLAAALCLMWLVCH